MHIQQYDTGTATGKKVLDPHSKIEIRRGGKPIQKKRFTGNKAEGRKKGRELDAPKEHPLKTAWFPKRLPAAGVWLLHTGPGSSPRCRADFFAFQVPAFGGTQPAQVQSGAFGEVPRESLNLCRRGLNKQPKSIPICLKRGSACFTMMKRFRSQNYHLLGVRLGPVRNALPALGSSSEM